MGANAEGGSSVKSSPACGSAAAVRTEPQSGFGVRESKYGIHTDLVRIRSILLLGNPLPDFRMADGHAFHWKFRKASSVLIGSSRIPRRVKREESAFSIDHGEFTFFEWVLLCVLVGLTVTSFILMLTAELGIFRIRFWILSLIVYDLSLLVLLLGSKKPFRFSTLLSGFKIPWVRHTGFRLRYSDFFYFESAC